MRRQFGSLGTYKSHIWGIYSKVTWGTEEAETSQFWQPSYILSYILSTIQECEGYMGLSLTLGEIYKSLFVWHII